MEKHQLIFEIWVLEDQVIPQRSRLYHVKPLYVKTPFVESLTSFIVRIADMHSVPTRKLIIQELLPLLGKKYLYDNGESSNVTALWKDASALNGANMSSKNWVQVMERLTLNTELQFTTMLPWVNILSSKGLVRRSRAWCPYCYEMWRANKQTIYDPLLWSLEVVTICSHHNTPLLLRCPYADCKRYIHMLTSQARPGHCSNCGRWLGIQYAARMDIHASHLDDEELRWQQWIVIEMGKLIAAAPALIKLPQMESFAEAVEAYLYEVADGNVSAVARKFRVARKTVREWRKGVQLPQLSSLLQFCYICGLSPLSLFSQGFKLKEALHEVERVVIEPKPTKYYRAFDPERIRPALEAELCSDEYPPPTMSKVAKKLRYDHSFLYKYFPDLCKAISAKFEKYRANQCEERKRHIIDEVRQATLEVHAQGVYPSQVRVRSLLAKPGSIRVPEALSTWHNTLEELGWKSKLLS